jgi:hypothetical protein
MSVDITPGEARFWELAQSLLDQAGVTRSTMMGFSCLRLPGQGGTVRAQRSPLPGMGRHPVHTTPHLGPSSRRCGHRGREENVTADPAQTVQLIGPLPAVEFGDQALRSDRAERVFDDARDLVPIHAVLAVGVEMDAEPVREHT